MTTRTVTARRRRQLGDAIRRERERAKLGQGDLGSAAEMTQPDISKLERGQRDLSPFQLQRIAGRLGLTVDALLSRAASSRRRLGNSPQRPE